MTPVLQGQTAAAAAAPNTTSELNFLVFTNESP
jgi:hypothetical protein